MPRNNRNVKSSKVKSSKVKSSKVKSSKVKSSKVKSSKVKSKNISGGGRNSEKDKSRKVNSNNWTVINARNTSDGTNLGRGPSFGSEMMRKVRRLFGVKKSPTVNKLEKKKEQIEKVKHEVDVLLESNRDKSRDDIFIFLTTTRKISRKHPYFESDHWKNLKI
jgi:hypothetical protein